MTQQAQDLCQQAVNALREHDVVLASTYAQTTAINRKLALAAPAGVFGNTISTFADWLAKLWEAHGDGRVPVAPLQRQVLCQAVLAARTCTNLQNTPNVPLALAKLVQHGLGMPAFSEGRSSAGLSAAEVELLECTDAYADELHTRGLIEQGQMLAYVANKAEEVFARPYSVYMLDSAPLPYQQQWFFDVCQGSVALVHDTIEPAPLERLHEELDVRFAFPAGAYAQPKVLLAAITDALGEGRSGTAGNGGTGMPGDASGDVTGDASGDVHEVLPQIIVAVRNPLHLYKQLATPLASRGITAAVRARVPLATTGLCQMLQSARRVLAVGGPAWDKHALVDVLHAPYLGLKKYTVWAWDEYLRSDRLLDRDTVLRWLENGIPEGANVPRQLRGGYAGFAQIMALAADPLAPQAFFPVVKRLAQLQSQGAITRAYAEEQLAAAQAMAEIADVVRDAVGQEHGEGTTMFYRLLESGSVSLAHTTAGKAAGQQPQVLFANQETASTRLPSSANTVVVGDLTSGDYPLTDCLDAVDALLARLGMGKQETELARQRRQFAHLLAVPTNRLVLERTLCDANGNPRYPCAMLEELVDAYRRPEDIATGDDIDNAYRLPESLQRAISYEAGEDNLLDNVEPGLVEQLGLPLQDNPVSRGALHSETARHNAAFPYEPVGDDATGGEAITDDLTSSSPAEDGTDCLWLSPTSVDLYRDCPYRYFVQRRLNLTVPDEDFGPASRGSFLHRVMERFYRQFGRKVTYENLPEAQALLFGAGADATDVGKGGTDTTSGGNGSGLFAQIVAEQPNLPPQARYAAIPGTTEEMEYAQLRLLAQGWLRFEAGFLPAFTPVAFELHLQGEQLGGCAFNGYVDRLDVDLKTGNAIVIDYKGALKRQYRPLDTYYKEFRGWQQEGYVQAALYAALLNRAIERGGPLQLPAALAGLPEAQAGLGSDTATDTVQVNAVVGALYVSYNQGNPITGAFDPRFIGAGDIPTLELPQIGRLAAEGDYTFSAFLDQVEVRVANVVERIKAGDFEPAPSCADACNWCAIEACERREGGAR